MAIMQRVGALARQALPGVAGFSLGFHWTAHLTLSLALVASLLGWRQASLDRDLEHARAAEAGARAAGASLVVKERRRQSTGKATERAAVALSQASQGHPTWADAPVPQEVQDALAP